MAQDTERPSGFVPRNPACERILDTIDVAHAQLEAAPEMQAYHATPAYRDVQAQTARYQADNCGPTVAVYPDDAQACNELAAHIQAAAAALDQTAEARAVRRSSPYRLEADSIAHAHAAGCYAESIVAPVCHDLTVRMAAAEDRLQRCPAWTAVRREPAAARLAASREGLVQHVCHGDTSDPPPCEGLRREARAAMHALLASPAYVALVATPDFLVLHGAAFEGLRHDCWPASFAQAYDTGDWL